MATSAHDVTQLLQAWSGGDSAALERLAPFVYAELHRVAKRYMRREPPGHVLQTTALVHEAYLRLVDASDVDWRDRTHFFAVAARIMRHILVDIARAQRNLKRGGEFRLVPLNEAGAVAEARHPDLIALDEALSLLEGTDPRKSRVVELRYFAGLSVKETADVLAVSPDTVMRDWRLARMWLLRELERGSPP